MGMVGKLPMKNMLPTGILDCHRKLECQDIVIIREIIYYIQWFTTQATHPYTLCQVYTVTRIYHQIKF